MFAIIFMLFFLIILFVVGIGIFRTAMGGLLALAHTAKSQNLDTLFQSIKKQIEVAGANSGTVSENGSAAQTMSPELTALINQYQNQMAQLTKLQRMRHEANLGEIALTAADAGIDWKPPLKKQS